MNNTSAENPKSHLAKNNVLVDSAQSPLLRPICVKKYTSIRLESKPTHLRVANFSFDAKIYSFILLFFQNMTESGKKATKTAPSTYEISWQHWEQRNFDHKKNNKIEALSIKFAEILIFLNLIKKTEKIS